MEKTSFLVKTGKDAVTVSSLVAAVVAGGVAGLAVGSKIITLLSKKK